MAKNILLFADGTGNEGGLLPDESRTNVYKLYRATRNGPDLRIDPRRQVAFYLHGIGTPTPGQSSAISAVASSEIEFGIGGCEPPQSHFLCGRGRHRLGYRSPAKVGRGGGVCSLPPCAYATEASRYQQAGGLVFRDADKIEGSRKSGARPLHDTGNHRSVER
jgi:hypothetical protein